MKKHFLLTLYIISTAFVNISAQNPYINKVWEYRPAPGQFVNELPLYEQGDNANDMRLKAEECLANHEQIMISLGGWGGYVIFGFDHLVPNFKGEYDLKILGNAFYANANPNDTTALGGSSEPGIVMVSWDRNGNGCPDDEWYELAGSDYHAPTTKHNYVCTYYRPSAAHTPTPDNSYQYLNDTTYIRWADNWGAQGYISRNIYHTQDYFPAWIDADSLTFCGTRLRNNAIDESGTGHYYVLYCFDWGYVDNQPNYISQSDLLLDDNHPMRHKSEFKIDWAVDANGNHVDLPGINFVKVYTGVNQYNGWLGEASTEVMDAWDLHMLDADGNDLPLSIDNISTHNTSPSPREIFTIDGRKINGPVKPGIYIVHDEKGYHKTLMK